MLQIRALSFLLPFCLLACAEATTISPLTYQAVACGGAFAPCNFTAFQRTPTPGDLLGLTSDLLRDYFLSEGLNVGAGVFTWTARGANDQGFVFGSVSGSNMIHTQFVYRHDTILCCTTDEPFFLYGINDNDLIVGMDPYNGAMSGFLASARMLDADRNPIPLNIIPDPRVGAALDFYSFVAIDNQNDILAQPRFTGTQSYILHPVVQHRYSLMSVTAFGDDPPAPEPEAFWPVLVGIALIAGAKMRGQRK